MAQASKNTRTAKSRVKAQPVPATVQPMPIHPALKSADPTLTNLSTVEHIVVLMMENRSFDHMLGYLSLEEGRSIDGLKAGMSNSYGGKKYPIKHLPTKTMSNKEDPCHKGACVAEQLSGANGGFVANFAKTHPNSADPGVVMGYYNKQDLPTFDLLARNYCVCDRWFSPVPGETWPNRLYAMTGRCDGSLDNKFIPSYSIASFVRHLDESAVSWGWFGIALTNTLHLTDPDYRSSSNFKRLDPDFYQSAMNGSLPSVCWIDPDFGILSSHQNDDHPPVDITAGQDLVLKVYHALSKGPKWANTLLIVVYDEHGGFFDHVTPGVAADDNPAFRRYGARVPAFIVSPNIAPGSVSSTVYDHTSIIKTILLRFASANGVPDMGARVANAAHLGDLLSTPARKAVPAPMTLVSKIAQWKAQAFKDRFSAQGIASRGEDELSDFQAGLLRASPIVKGTMLTPADENKPKLEPKHNKPIAKSGANTVKKPKRKSAPSA